MTDAQDMIRWHVAATQPARERLAEEQLKAQGFTAFLPTCRKTLRANRRVRDVIRPLFPGYVFVAFDGDPARIRSVNGTRGIKRLLGHDGWPSPLPDGFVETMQAHLNPDGTISHRAGFQVGARVEMATGPFAKQVGEILAMDERGRVTVLLQVLSTHIPVSTRATELLPA